MLISYLIGFTFEEAMVMADMDIDSMMENGDETYYDDEYVDTMSLYKSEPGEYCYNCGSYSMIAEGGCHVCTNCGFERCG
jgi:hypothetical protein